MEGQAEVGAAATRVLLGRWDEQVRLFRWKSLADAAAWRHRRRPRGVVREAIVEAYRPGANIVRWPGRETRLISR